MSYETFKQSMNQEYAKVCDIPGARKRGYRPKDPFQARLLSRLLFRLGNDPQEAVLGLEELVKQSSSSIAVRVFYEEKLAALVRELGKR